MVKANLTYLLCAEVASSLVTDSAVPQPTSVRCRSNSVEPENQLNFEIIITIAAKVDTIGFISVGRVEERP